MKKAIFVTIVILLLKLVFTGCGRSGYSDEIPQAPLSETAIISIGNADVKVCTQEYDEPAYVMIDPDEIFDMYVRAISPVAEASSSIIGVFTAMQAESHGTEQVSMTISGRVSQTLAGAIGSELHMEMLTVMDGIEIPVTAFYRNGMYYVDMAGMGIRMPMDYLVLAGQTHVGVDDFLFEGYTILHNYGFQLPNGGYSVFFTLASSAVYRMVEQEMRELFYEVNHLTFSDIRVSANLDANRKLESVSYHISFMMETEGQPISMHYSIEFSIETEGQVLLGTCPSAYSTTQKARYFICKCAVLWYNSSTYHQIVKNYIRLHNYEA